MRTAPTSLKVSKFGNPVRIFRFSTFVARDRDSLASDRVGEGAAPIDLVVTLVPLVSCSLYNHYHQVVDLLKVLVVLYSYDYSITCHHLHVPIDSLHFYMRHLPNMGE